MILILHSTGISFADDKYDPLVLSGSKKAEVIDLSFKDKDREIPIRIYLPSAKKTPHPVVLFSHGLGGSREGSSYLGSHWALRGYVAVFIQHPGSDTSVWKGKPVRQRMHAMKKAANWQNFQLRGNDVKALINQLEIWNKQDGDLLASKWILKRLVCLDIPSGR